VSRDELLEEPSHPRTMLKCSWRCSRIKPQPSSVEALMAATAAVRWAFHLSAAEHQLVCEEAMRRGEQQLADDLFRLETRAPR
jgi:hypothetical protein